MNVRPEGFTEAGITTDNLDGWTEFLVNVGGFEVIWTGASPAATKRLWGIAPQTRVLETLLGPPGSKTGLIRLFQFDGIRQEVIRTDTKTWDSGGIFDLDVRVANLHAYVESMKRQGWSGVSEPVDWPFGSLEVREWLAIGPDSVVLALVQRLAPPLEGGKAFEKFSDVFNSSQIVSDMTRAMGFYSDLGFVEIVHHQGPLGGKGGEVLGLTPEEAPITPVDLVIMQGQGVLSGSVELVKIEGKPDRNVSSLGQPYNLGLNLLRFPVSDLDSYIVELRKRGIRLVLDEAISSPLEPFGETEFIALQTPDGAWLEFYQAIN